MLAVKIHDEFKCYFFENFKVNSNFLLFTLKYVFGVNHWLARVHLSFIISTLARISYFRTSLCGFFSEILMKGLAFYFGSKENSRITAIGNSQSHFKSEKN